MMSNMVCKLYDLFSHDKNEYVIYTEPIYTKYNGVYGYLTVSHFNIYFFWSIDGTMTVDNVSDRFRVEYTSDK